MKTTREFRNKVRETYDSNLNITIAELHQMFPMLTLKQLKNILMSEWE